MPALVAAMVAIALASAGLGLAQNDAPRGDLYSAKAIQALEQCFDSLGNFTCGGGITGTGEANQAAVWNSVDDLRASVIVNDNDTDYTIDTPDGGVVSIFGGGVAGDVNIDQPDGGTINIGTDGADFISLGETTTTDTITLQGNDFDFDAVNSITIGVSAGFLTATADGVFISGATSNVNLEATTASVDIRSVSSIFGTIGLTNRLLVDTPPAAGVGGTMSDFAATLNAMDGSDIVNGLQLDFDNANHTGSGNQFRGLFITNLLADAQAVASAIQVDSGWDAFITADVDANGWSADDDPPAGTVAFYVDESGADCNLIARLADGTEVVVAALVVAGNCP